MFRIFFLLSIFVGLSIDNIGMYNFIPVKKQSVGGNTSKKGSPNNINNVRSKVVKKGKANVIKKNNIMDEDEEGSNVEEIIKKKSIMPEKEVPIQEGSEYAGLDEKFKIEEDATIQEMAFYYYIAVSFLLYIFNKYIDKGSGIFSISGGRDGYKGPADEDVFAVYKEFWGTNAQVDSTYDRCLLRFCEKHLKKFLGGNWKKQISYAEAYKGMKDKVVSFLKEDEKIIFGDWILLKEKWEDPQVQWIFTVALQLFAYKKLYDHIKDEIFSGDNNEENNVSDVIIHDFYYVQLMSEMLYGIFLNLINSFVKNNNIIATRDIFFLKMLPMKEVKMIKTSNRFCAAFTNLVFRPARHEGSSCWLLDCLYPIIIQMDNQKR